MPWFYDYSERRYARVPFFSRLKLLAKPEETFPDDSPIFARIWRFLLQRLASGPARLSEKDIWLGANCSRGSVRDALSQFFVQGRLTREVEPFVLRFRDLPTEARAQWRKLLFPLPGSVARRVALEVTPGKSELKRDGLRAKASRYWLEKHSFDLLLEAWHRLHPR